MLLRCETYIVCVCVCVLNLGTFHATTQQCCFKIAFQMENAPRNRVFHQNIVKAGML